MSVRFNKEGTAFANAGQTFIGGMVPHPMQLAGAIPFKGQTWRTGVSSTLRAVMNLAKVPLEGSGEETH